MRTHDIRLSENQIRVLMLALNKLGPVTPEAIQFMLGGIQDKDSDPASYAPSNLQGLFRMTLEIPDAQYGKDTLNSFVL